MHILVPVKRVVDPDVKVRVRRDGSGVDTANLKMAINPFDEVALEQAIRLREQGAATRVTAVSCADAAARDVLRLALALGADAAVLVETAGVPTPLAEARLLRAVAAREGIGLVLCGRQATDDDLGATVPMLAALLDWPQALPVSRLALQGEELEVACEADDGVDCLALPLPAVLGVDLRLCDPRKVTLPALARARKAPIETLAAGELADCDVAALPIVEISEPPTRAAGIRVETPQALVDRLRALPVLAGR